MRKFCAAAIGGSLLLATAAYADVPGRDWISSAKASRILAAKGYRVTKIEADDGHWEGEAWKGRTKFDFHVDPISGRIIKLEPDRD